MGRRPDPQRRAELLAACAGDLLAHGLAGATLSRLAAAAGTSTRMLVYHFGTRDRLLLEALRLARGRQRALYERALDPVGGMPYPRVLRRAWATITRPEAFPYLSLFNELHDLPRTASPWPEFRDLSILDWLPAMERGLRADRYRNAPALATMLVATARGLLSDLVTTGDRRRTTAGWHAAVRLLASAPRSHP